MSAFRAQSLAVLVLVHAHVRMRVLAHTDSSRHSRRALPAALRHRASAAIHRADWAMPVVCTLLRSGLGQLPQRRRCRLQLLSAFLA